MKSVYEVLVKIDNEIKELSKDCRIKQKTATVFENAPLALIQTDIEARISTLKMLREFITQEEPEHTKDCHFWQDCHNGFDEPRACNCRVSKNKKDSPHAS
jgi:hypothetical protein